MACVAVVNIPQGTCSKPFHVHEISTSALHESRGNVKISFPLQVGLTASGEMLPISPIPNIFWPKLINIASDCHEQNVKLRRWNNTGSLGTFTLQTTRDIPAGQNLQLWFSEDVMISDLGIPPYLSPFNIKGGNSYVCHECQEEFERPNLLKLHLALRCDRLSLETIWKRLKLAGPSPLLVNPPYLLNLSSSMNLSGSPNPLFNVPLSKTSSPAILQLSPPSSQLPPNQVRNRHHGILPLPDSRSHHINKGSAGITSSSTSSSTPSPVIGVDAPVDVPISPAEAEPPEANGRNLVVQEQHHHHARLEAIVSNMGKAKNGHVCLYCGKLYSRKYGLKIHIRTHTGYKPLRCKICHRPFGDPSNLNKHVRLHSDGTTPYSKVLVRRRDLDRHIRTRHHGVSGQPNSRNNGNCNIMQQQSSSAGHSRSSTVTSSMVSGSRL